MQFLMEAQLLSVQQVTVDGNIYAKAFVASSPDGNSEAIASVTSMNIAPDRAQELFRYVNEAGIQLAETVRLNIKAVRGSQNSVRNIIQGIERIPSAGGTGTASAGSAKDKQDK